MSQRSLVMFWGAVAAAVFLLGGGVSSVRSVVTGGGAEAVLLLVLSAVGLAAALFVAGRVVFVVGRFQRRARGR